MRRTLAAVVLVTEALVVLFAVLVAKELSDLPTGTVVAVGGGLSVACLLLTGLLRYRWAYAAGGALQVAVVLTGIAVPIMWLIGALFALMWAVFMRLSTKVEQQQAAAAAGGAPPGGAAAPR